MLSLREGARIIVQTIAWTASASLRGDRDVQERATQLLAQNLSPKQREQFEGRGCFEVIGGDTGRRYRIWHGLQMNVEVLNSHGRRIALLCFLPEGRLPVGDMLLAQKLALELFETETLAVANRLPSTYGSQHPQAGDASP